MLALLLLTACTPNNEQTLPQRHPPVLAARQTEQAPPAAAKPVKEKPAALSAPSYDLTLDLEQRREGLIDELGSRTGTAVAGDVFLLVSPAGEAALAGSLDITRRALEALYNGRFGRRPTRAISVLLFPEAASYSSHCRKRYGQPCTSPYGFYMHSERRIVMNVGLGLGTLTHELVHPLVEADFPNAPTWLNEGIASLFEQFTLPRKGEIHGYKNWRHPRLLQAIRSKQERSVATPAALMTMDEDTFRGDLEDLNYATARYLCQWLDQKRLLWAFYARFRDGYATDPTGRRAFAEAVGKPPEEVEEEWQRWVRAL